MRHVERAPRNVPRGRASLHPRLTLAQLRRACNAALRENGRWNMPPRSYAEYARLLGEERKEISMVLGGGKTNRRVRDLLERLALGQAWGAIDAARRRRAPIRRTRPDKRRRG